VRERGIPASLLKGDDSLWGEDIGRIGVEAIMTHSNKRSRGDLLLCHNPLTLPEPGIPEINLW